MITASGLVSKNTDKPVVSSINLVLPGSITVNQRIKARVDVKMSLKGAKIPKITYSSSDPKIASIDANGNIKPLRDGKVYIKAAVGNVFSKAALNILPVVEDIELKVNGSMKIGEKTKADLVIRMIPPGAQIPPIKYETSDNSVISIDSEGNIEAVGPGEAKITAYVGTSSINQSIIITKKETEDNNKKEDVPNKEGSSTESQPENKPSETVSPSEDSKELKQQTIIGAYWFGEQIPGVDSNFIWKTGSPEDTFVISTKEYITALDYTQLYKFLDNAGVDFDLVSENDSIKLNRANIGMVYQINGKYRGFYLKLRPEDAAKMKIDARYRLVVKNSNDKYQWKTDGDIFLAKKAIDTTASTPLAKRAGVKTRMDEFNYFIDVLQLVHPYTINGFTDEQKKLIDKAKNSINENISKEDFFFLMNDILVTFHDGHTALNYSYSSNDKWLDMPFLWLDDGIIITNDCNEFKKGDKILNIGGKSDAELLQEFTKVIPAENIYWVKEMSRDKLISSIYLKHLRLVNDDGTVSLRLDRNGSQLDLKVPLRNGVSFWPNNSPKDWVRYEIDTSSSLGILHIDRCENSDTFINKVSEFFTDVSKNNIRNIAIDLRHNPGGDSNVINTILKYINISSYKWYSSDARYSIYANAAIPGEPASGSQHYDSAIMALDKSDVKKEQIFSGNVYVISSNATFSSAMMILGVIRDNGIGKIVGEPSGNSPSHTGYPIQFDLPISRFHLGVSHIKWVRRGGAGTEKILEPDIKVSTTRNDIITNTDAQIEALKKIIASGK